MDRPPSQPAASGIAADEAAHLQAGRQELRGIRRALWLIAAAVLIGLALLARPVVVPLLFALVISMTLYPVVRRLARLGGAVVRPGG